MCVCVTTHPHPALCVFLVTFHCFCTGDPQGRDVCAGVSRSQGQAAIEEIEVFFMEMMDMNGGLNPNITEK